MQIPDIRDDELFLSEKKWMEVRNDGRVYQKTTVLYKQPIMYKDYIYIPEDFEPLYNIYASHTTHVWKALCESCDPQWQNLLISKLMRVYISYVPSIISIPSNTFISQMSKKISKKYLQIEIYRALVDHSTRCYYEENDIGCILIKKERPIQKNHVASILYKIWKFKYMRFKPDLILADDIVKCYLTNDETLRHNWTMAHGKRYDNLPRTLQRKERFKYLSQHYLYGSFNSS